jgi:hypothetical protein
MDLQVYNLKTGTDSLLLEPLLHAVGKEHMMEGVHVSNITIY